MTRTLALALLLGGLMLGAYAVSVPAKAVVAQILLQRAWHATRHEGAPHRPWPGAEHWPVARLHFPTLDESHIVLEGDGGHVLAFAPGRNPRSAQPGTPGTTVISAHRDTHFNRLGALQVGDPITLEHEGGSTDYRVSTTRVVDARDTTIAIRDRHELVLVTCWPLRAIAPGGPHRFVVFARADPAAPAGSRIDLGQTFAARSLP